MIFHQTQRESDKGIKDIFTWKNSYISGELKSLKNIFPPERSFTPSALTISPRKNVPVSSIARHGFDAFQCDEKLPIAILPNHQLKYDIVEIENILKAAKGKMILKVLASKKQLKKLEFADNGKVEWLGELDMTAYHETFQNASFLIAGMNPDIKNPIYFSGNPSSTIAYAIHYGLPIIGHEAISHEYLALHKGEGGLPVGYWHNGTSHNMITLTQEAIHDWYRNCRSWRNENDVLVYCTKGCK